MKKEILFGIPIHCIKIDPKSYNKKQIIKIIKHNYKINKFRDKGYDQGESNIHHSYHDLDNKEFKNIDYRGVGLMDVYDKVFKTFANDILKHKKHFLYKYDIVNYTAMQKDQFMTSHQHLPSADFSAIHYIQFDEKKHTPTAFINTHDFSSYLEYIRTTFIKCCDDNNLDNSYLFPRYKYSAKEDEMIIFPSCLKHEIPRQPYNLNKLRITIASNLTIKQ